MELKGFQRSFLQKEAHHLKPTVNIGKNGFTDAIINAVSESLDNHELIKVKFVDFKDEKKEIAIQLAEKCNCSLVKLIGNIAILYKAKDDVQERQYHVPGSYSGENN